MSCGDMQSRLHECLGIDRLPEDLAEHVQRCSECRRVWEDLQRLGGMLGRTEQFHPDSVEVARTIDGLEARLDLLGEPPPATRLNWRRYVLPVAASIALLFSLAMYGNRVYESTATDSAAGEASDYESWASIETTSEELSEATLDLLLHDFADRRALEPSEFLLDDLSDDEVEYLEKNFDITEVL